MNYSAFKYHSSFNKWAVIEKFSNSFIKTMFIVYMDNNPLTFILTSAKLNATGQRWASVLGHFDIKIIF